MGQKGEIILPSYSSDNDIWQIFIDLFQMIADVKFQGLRRNINQHPLASHLLLKHYHGMFTAAITKSLVKFDLPEYFKAACTLSLLKKLNLDEDLRKTTGLCLATADA